MGQESKIGLILTGGGARAAYQIGVLQGVANILLDAGWPRSANPFAIICGTSAGAINAAALASQADDFFGGLESTGSVWSGVEAAHVYRSDSLGVLRSGTKWLSLLSFGWLLRQWRANPPNSLLDNAPLKSLLARMLDLDRLDAALRDGHLHALAVTAFSYSSGEHVTFYQTHADVAAWSRSQRVAEQTNLGVDHLLASAAIPLIFPAMPISRNGAVNYFGDGSMRQLAPISPAIHLGADKVLVIGAGRLHEKQDRSASLQGYPSLAQIAGQAMSNIFLDSLAVDIERMNRINSTVAVLTEQQRKRTGLRPISMLTIAPSERLDDMASRHVDSLPTPVKLLLGAIGATDAKGGALASYLLFEASFTQELMALGQRDAQCQEKQILEFFALPHQAMPAVPEKSFYSQA